jgi:hypothetical protein
MNTPRRWKSGWSESARTTQCREDLDLMIHAVEKLLVALDFAQAERDYARAALSEVTACHNPDGTPPEESRK